MPDDMHYVTFSPDDTWRDMMMAYIDAGGDILYPGDEKEILLRGVLAFVVQLLGTVDTGIKMSKIRFAVDEYLDIIGEDKFFERIPAQASQCTVEIAFNDRGVPQTIEAGTTMTADGVRVFALEDDIRYQGIAETITARVRCTETGECGNCIVSGTAMRMLQSHYIIDSIVAVSDASGGQDQEDDETYRERMRTYGNYNTTTGTKYQYESKAKAVSSDILDARALRISGGVVGVYLLLRDGADAEQMQADVTAAMLPDNVRTLTDQLEVHMAAEIPYTLEVHYTAEDWQDIGDAVLQAVDEYQAWQDRCIGRAFNPDKLKAKLYNAGASRVYFASSSSFNGGDVAFTAINSNERCKGKITLVGDN